MQSIKYPYAVCVENKGKHFVAGPIIVKAVNWERIDSWPVTHCSKADRDF